MKLKICSYCGNECYLWKSTPKLCKTPEMLIQFVCDHFGVNKNDVSGQSRKREFVIPRQISMHLIKRLFPDIRLKKIGGMFDGRDHSSVLHSIKTVDDRIDTDRNFKREYNNIVKMM